MNGVTGAFITAELSWRKVKGLKLSVGARLQRINFYAVGAGEPSHRQYSQHLPQFGESLALPGAQVNSTDGKEAQNYLSYFNFVVIGCC